METAAHRSSQAPDKKFIDRLTKAVESNLEVREFGVEDLAREVGMSRSLIYRKLQSITNQSVSRFIREIRLEKAMELLKQSEGTVSDIAYRVGFGSPAYFITCFHEKYGYPPGEVKYRNLPKETRERKIPYKLVWISFGIIAFITVGFVVTKSILNQTTKISAIPITEKSIAILPFENLSNDPENKFLAFGIVDNILSQLAGINGIKAISRTSSANYSQTSKSIPEIGQELGADFILEGSVQKFEENILIIVQLIQSDEDKHIWSDEYKVKLKDFLKVQSKISKEIARELKNILSETEIESIEKWSSQNAEAYNMYIKGRYFLDNRTPESFESSLKYFSRAIEIDPEFAQAYAGIGYTYELLTGWKIIPFDEGHRKAKEFTLKAINLNNALPEAHAMLAEIYWRHERKFKEAELQFKKAIRLGPNYSIAYYLYAQYLQCLGRKEEARQQINKATELDPLSKMNHVESASMYYHAGLLQNALFELELILEMDPDFIEANYVLFFLYIEMNMPEEAFNAFKKINKVVPDEHEVDKIFLTSGIEGILYYLIDFGEQLDEPRYYPIAQYYAILGQKEEVLDMLRRLISEDNSIAQILLVLDNRHFQKFISDPDFQQIFAEIEQMKSDLIN